MAMLSNMTAQELCELLDEYGIKHGPVVESTRALYEKKLKDAMANKRKAKPSPDRTYYREEEQVTYINHRRPLRHEGYGDRGDPVLRSEYRNLDATDEPIVHRTPAPYLSTSQSWHATQKPETPRGVPPGPASPRFVPVWMQVLLFLLVTAFLVFVFINMEPADTEPFKKLT